MPTGKKRILIVDDSSSVREQVVAALNGEYDCLSASDGEQALETTLREPVDFIVTDLHMPNMSGLELLRELRSQEKWDHLPVLVMTTETGLAEVNECRRLGCAGYVLKPLEKTYLLAKVRKLLADTPAVA
jgi:two-component system chemotaxis response regulator CheY